MLNLEIYLVSLNYNCIYKKKIYKTIQYTMFKKEFGLKNGGGV